MVTTTASTAQIVPTIHHAVLECPGRCNMPSEYRGRGSEASCIRHAPRDENVARRAARRRVFDAPGFHHAERDVLQLLFAAEFGGEVGAQFFDHLAGTLVEDV